MVVNQTDRQPVKKKQWYLYSQADQMSDLLQGFQVIPDVANIKLGNSKNITSKF